MATDGRDHEILANSFIMNTVFIKFLRIDFVLFGLTHYMPLNGDNSLELYRLSNTVLN